MVWHRAQLSSGAPLKFQIIEITVSSVVAPSRCRNDRAYAPRPDRLCKLRGKCFCYTLIILRRGRLEPVGGRPMPYIAYLSTGSRFKLLTAKAKFSAGAEV